MPSAQNREGVHLLLIEDSYEDAKLARRAFGQSKWVNSIDHVDDGQRAIDYLQKRDPFQRARKPNLILLDLDLPKLHGTKVLEFIKNDSRFAKISVIVLTTSRSEVDVARSYELHANAYVQKPLEFEKFVEVALRVEQFWLQLVELPKVE